MIFQNAAAEAEHYEQLGKPKSEKSKSHNLFKSDGFISGGWVDIANRWSCITKNLWGTLKNASANFH